MQCEIVAKFFDLLSVISAQQKLPMEYSDGQVIYHAEMELLQQISENPDANVSDLSRMSGVTKSAITQMGSKLLDKGVIEKYSVPTNKKEKYFRLTKAGEAIRHEHEEYHKDASREMQVYLCSLEERDKRTIMEFMEKMKKCMPVCTFPCKCAQGESCMLHNVNVAST